MDLSTGEEGDDDGRGVFQYCTKLETVRLPESLRKIGDYIFYDCKALVHVNIPSGVNEIGIQAFYVCSSLETVTIPEGIVNLPDGIFTFCESLKSVKLPSSLKTIGNSVFCECSSLTTINDDALKGVTYMGEYAFYQCTSLTTFKLPPLLKTIEESTFWGCESLSKVVLPPSLEMIGKGAFYGCSHPKLTIDLPETVTSISQHALYGCSIRLPMSLSMLTNGGDVQGLLYGVKEVVMSSRVNLSLLVDHINGIPNDELDPNLKFKILYSSSHGVAPIHDSFFTFETYPMQFKQLYKVGGRDALQDIAALFFTRKLALYADILRSTSVEVPVALLYNILPFLYGNAEGKESKQKIESMKEIVRGVGKLLARADEYAMLKNAVRENNAMKAEIDELKRTITELSEQSTGGGRKKRRK